MAELQQNILRLPEELKFKIMFYLIEPQPISLLEDIQGYSSSKKEVEELYSNYYRQYMIDFDLENEDKNWLMNDVMRYLNNDIPTMISLRQSYYEIFLRNPFIYNKQKIHKYIHNVIVPKIGSESENVRQEIIQYYKQYLPSYPQRLIHLFIRRLYDKSIQSEFNTYWGLMNNEERRGMIAFARVHMDRNL